MSIFHSQKEAEQAEKEFEKVFENKELPTEIKEVSIKEKELNILELLVKLEIFTSKAEARRVVEQGGIKFVFDNQTEIKLDWKEIIKIRKGLIVQAGRRKFRKII